MMAQENCPPTGNDANLATFDIDQLNDLLQHKSMLLTAALLSNLVNRPYINSLLQDVELIKAELEQRKQKEKTPGSGSSLGG